MQTALPKPDKDTGVLAAVIPAQSTATAAAPVPERDGACNSSSESAVVASFYVFQRVHVPTAWFFLAIAIVMLIATNVSMLLRYTWELATYSESGGVPLAATGAVEMPHTFPSTIEDEALNGFDCHKYMGPGMLHVFAIMVICVAYVGLLALVRFAARKFNPAKPRRSVTVKAVALGLFLAAAAPAQFAVCVAWWTSEVAATFSDSDAVRECVNHLTIKTVVVGVAAFDLRAAAMPRGWKLFSNGSFTASVCALIPRSTEISFTSTGVDPLTITTNVTVAHLWAGVALPCTDLSAIQAEYRFALNGTDDDGNCVACVGVFVPDAFGLARLTRIMHKLDTIDVSSFASVFKKFEFVIVWLYVPAVALAYFVMWIIIIVNEAVVRDDGGSGVGNSFPLHCRGSNTTEQLTRDVDHGNSNGCTDVDGMSNHSNCDETFEETETHALLGSCEETHNGSDNYGDVTGDILTVTVDCSTTPEAKKIR